MMANKRENVLKMEELHLRNKLSLMYVKRQDRFLKLIHFLKSLKPHKPYVPSSPNNHIIKEKHIKRNLQMNNKELNVCFPAFMLVRV